MTDITLLPPAERVSAGDVIVTFRLINFLRCGTRAET